MQTDAEHQQHYADLGELCGECLIGNEAGRERTDDDPGQQIAEQCRQAQTRGDEADDEGEAECGGNGGDQRDVMGHRRRTGPVGKRAADK